jgi:hypothetical protein
MLFVLQNFSRVASCGPLRQRHVIYRKIIYAVHLDPRRDAILAWVVLSHDDEVYACTFLP